MKILSSKEVQERTSLSRASLTRLIEAGTFPRGFIIEGASRRAWSEIAVNEWIQKQINNAKQESAQ